MATLNPGEEYSNPYPYPYPLNVFVPSFVTVKLSSRDNYGVWKTQILCLFESHEMLGFINGTWSVADKNNMLWRRSDALVKGWTLGSLSEQALKCVINLVKEHDDYFTAKDVWDTLQTVYGPALPLIQQPAAGDRSEEIIIEAESNGEEKTEEERNEEEEKKHEAEKKKKQAEIEKAHHSLYEATLRKSFEEVDRIVKTNLVRVIDKVAINGNTALHVAVGATKKREFLEKMLNLATEDNQELDMLNADGSTVLHVAAIVGNTDAARIVVEKNQDLLLVKDKEGHTPLNKALSNMHTDTYLYLFEATKKHDKEMALLFAGSGGDELLVNAVSSNNYDAALELSKKYSKLHSDAVLMAIAQNFPRKLNIWERVVHKVVKNADGIHLLGVIIMFIAVISYGIAGSIIVIIKLREMRRMDSKMNNMWIIYIAVFFGAFIISPIISPIFRGAVVLIRTFLMKIIMMVHKMNKKLQCWTPISWICKPIQRIFTILQLHFTFVEMEAQMHHSATQLLKLVCELIKGSTDSIHHRDYYTNAILEATRQNAYEVVAIIVSFFPDAISCVNDDGHNIIQYAVINRSEKVYNLLYQMSEHRNVYRSIKDSSGNNLLHLAAKLAPTNKLNLISGAVFQMQRELHWFKEVKGFVCPLNIIQKNFFGETPEMVFTREHRELVIEGEKWMKATAKSYTITAALITTIMFAAAITVPGGNNQETGFPIFTTKISFQIFAISVAVSLFTSVTSLLMFLSILTARFAEQDFLFILPTNLLFALATLFISTTAMIIAFGATFFLVFGKINLWILIPMPPLQCLPIASFVSLQFPLIADLMRATYGRSMFGKKRDDPFY